MGNMNSNGNNTIQTDVQITEVSRPEGSKTLVCYGLWITSCWETEVNEVDESKDKLTIIVSHISNRRALYPVPS